MAVQAINVFGYQASEYMKIFGGSRGFVLKGKGPQPIMEFDDTTKHYTTKILNKRIEVYYLGLGTQVVKLPAEFQFPDELDDMSEVELIRPEACQVRRNIYVRAKGLQVKVATSKRGNSNG